jgi:hypothetical protein
MPRGVYPRRKPGRPRKSESPAPAAPAKPDFKDFNEFYQADPAFQELETPCLKAVKQAHEADMELRRHTFKLQRLMLVRDLALKALDSADGFEVSAIDPMNRTLGRDPEDVMTMLDLACDDITEIVYAMCEGITTQRRTVQQLKEVSDSLQQKRNQRVNELRPQWQEMERKKEAQAFA